MNMQHDCPWVRDMNMSRSMVKSLLEGITYSCDVKRTGTDLEICHLAVIV